MDGCKMKWGRKLITVMERATEWSERCDERWDEMIEPSRHQNGARAQSRMIKAWCFNTHNCSSSGQSSQSAFTAQSPIAWRPFLYRSFVRSFIAINQHILNIICTQKKRMDESKWTEQMCAKKKKEHFPKQQTREIVETRETNLHINNNRNHAMPIGWVIQWTSLSMSLPVPPPPTRSNYYLYSDYYCL